MAPYHEDCWGSPELIPMAMEQKEDNTQPASWGAEAGAALRSWAGQALPAVPAGLGTGGEAWDLDVVPIFPLKLLLSLDSSSA